MTSTGRAMRSGLAAMVLAAMFGCGGGGGNPEPTGTHLLTAARAGTGAGTITSVPAGVACGTTCSASFPGGSAVTLTAAPDANSTFTGWSGACSGTDACVLTMDADLAVTASFASIPRTLSVATTGTGAGTITSVPAGVACGTTCSASFPGGSAVTLTAAPDANSTFTGWSGACSGTDACVLTMDADLAVTASFALETPSSGTCETPGGRLYIGEYIVANDTYVNAESGHPLTGYTQCATLTPGSTLGTLKASWTWNWPVSAPVDTRATPTVIHGWKPWDAESTTPRLPRLVGDISSLTVDADVHQTIGANQISSFGIVGYLTTANTKSGDTLPIAKRFFVYRNEYGMGTRTPTASQIDIGGLQWDMVVTPGYVLYYPHAAANVPVTSLHVDLADFLADAVSRGAIDPAWWLSSVETGEIIYQGSGALTLDNYVVTVTAAPAGVNLLPDATAAMSILSEWRHWANGDASDVSLGVDEEGPYAYMMAVQSDDYGEASTTHDLDGATDHGWYDQLIAGTGPSTFTLSAGKQYRLGITAASDVAGQWVELVVQLNQDPWTTYAFLPFQVTTEAVQYLSPIFTVDTTVSDVWFVVNVGGNQAGSRFFFRDAQLMEIDERAPDHFRPATTSLQVAYQAGADGQYGTADDVVAGYHRHVYQASGYTQSEAWYVGPGADGSDGAWFTADDLQSGGWYEPPAQHYGWTVSGPGDDGVWFTDDDTIGSWEQFDTSGDPDTGINPLYDDPGPDGLWFTSDDHLSGYYLRSLNADGAETQRITYVGPGLDGIWFTADDEMSDAGYQVSEFSRGNRRWEAWDRQTRYTGPGLDGIWLTDDDEIGSYVVHAFADDSEYWTTETTYDAGADGVWMTEDDRVIGYSRAVNTY
jgi:hypothetical protein